MASRKNAPSWSDVKAIAPSSKPESRHDQVSERNTVKIIESRVAAAKLL